MRSIRLSKKPLVQQDQLIQLLKTISFHSTHKSRNNRRLSRSHLASQQNQLQARITISTQISSCANNTTARWLGWLTLSGHKSSIRMCKSGHKVNVRSNKLWGSRDISWKTNCRNKCKPRVKGSKDKVKLNVLEINRTYRWSSRNWFKMNWRTFNTLRKSNARSQLANNTKRVT